MSPLELRQLRSTSPTLAETMRACFLRAGVSKAAGSTRFVLGNPKAWLGTAYHEVLEKIVEVDLERGAVDAGVERLWNQAIIAQQRRVDGHALDHRFGSAATWPGYHVARASVLLRAREFADGLAPAVVQATKQASVAGPGGGIREQEFTACDGKLLGRPDVIRASEVVDYKSGAIFEYDEAAQDDVVKAAYVRQLRIYGYLVKQKLGWWPLRGILLPLAGAAVEVTLEPSECEREAIEAVALLDTYNEKVRADAAPEDFASPSAHACKWCPYKVLCPSFWQTVSPAWSGQLDGAAVEGVLADAPGVIHGGAARAIALDIQAGSEARRRAQIAPLNPAAHPIVTTLTRGERVRLIGLRVWANGVLVPGVRTVLFRLADVPTVRCGQGSHG